jgi:hypothetical protein
LKRAEDAVAALHESGLGAVRTEVPTGKIANSGIQFLTEQSRQGDD